MQATEKKEIPGPKGKPIVGVALEFKKDALTYMKNMREKYGGITRAKLGPYDVIFLFEPDYIKYCLATNNSNYHKAKNYKDLKVILKDGLLTNEDETWSTHRKIIQPVFHANKIIDYITQFNEITNEYIAKWSKMGEINDHLEMADLTSSVVTKTILGSEVEFDPTSISDAMAYLTYHLQKLNNSVMPIPHFIPTPDNRKYTKSLNIINSVVDEIIEKAKKTGERGTDVLSRLLIANDAEIDHTLSDSEIKDEIRTFFLAGHETTAITLTWTLYLLSKHKNIMNKMIAEIHSVIGKDKDPSAEDLKKLTYVEQVGNEVLRLYPPIYMFGRSPLEVDTIDGYEIPTGTTVATVPYVTHRDPAYWDDPDEFKPERFEKDPVHLYAFIPFGGGPRTCIGKNFALMELKIILTKIFQNHYVEMKYDQEVKPTAQFTLRPEKEIILLFKKQDN